jgi:hypothetical protein
MKLLPHRQFIIETPLPPSEVEARLRDAVEPPAFRLRKPERPFTGHVHGRTFDVMRSVHGRNSARPRIRGTVEAAGRGTRLTGTMQTHAIVLLLLGVLVFTLGSAFMALAIGSLRSGTFELPVLIPLGLVVALPVGMIVAFLPEARRSLAELGRVVDASHGELR